MKAFLLSAGKGTRLLPLTCSIPKCLVPIEGIPLMGIWFRLMKYHGVDAVLVNTHHLADQVHTYVKTSPVHGLKVKIFHEPELLGSAGTVAANRKFVEGEESFFVFYADNLTDMNLTDFYRFHQDRNSPFTMGLFRTTEPEECGIVNCDDDGRVIQFVEKPGNPTSDLANSGLYIAGQDLFDLIPDKPPVDFGSHVLPLLVGKMYGYPIESFFRDLGTMTRLKLACRDWPCAANRSFLAESRS